MRISVYELPFATSIHVNRIRRVKEMIWTMGCPNMAGLRTKEGSNLSIFLSWVWFKMIFRPLGLWHHLSFFFATKATLANGSHELIFTIARLRRRLVVLLQLRCQLHWDWWWDDSSSSSFGINCYGMPSQLNTWLISNSSKIECHKNTNTSRSQEAA